MPHVIDDLDIIIKMQNIHLLKFIAFTEGWNYMDLCKKYIH
jgi:hypothetical protein